MRITKGKSQADKFFSQHSNYIFDSVFKVVHGYIHGYLTGSNNATYVSRIAEDVENSIVCGISECATVDNPKNEYCL